MNIKDRTSSFFRRIHDFFLHHWTFNRTAMVGSIIALILLGIGVAWAVYDNKTYSDSSHDVKKAEKVANKDDEDLKEDISEEIKEIGISEVPTMMEVDKFIGTLDDSDAYDKLVDDEFGKGVYYLYTENLLVNASDKGFKKRAKIGHIKYELSGKNKPYGILYNPLVDTSDVSLNGLYTTDESGFQQISKNVKIGYETINENYNEDGDIEYKDGVKSLLVNFYLYPTKDMTVSQIQNELNNSGIAVDMETLVPGLTHERNSGVKSITKTQLVTFDKVDYKLDKIGEINSLIDSGTDWNKFNENTTIYTGTIVYGTMELDLNNLKDLYKYNYNKKTKEISNLPETVTMTGGQYGYTSELVKNDTRSSEVSFDYSAE